MSCEHDMQFPDVLSQRFVGHWELSVQSVHDPLRQTFGVHSLCWVQTCGGGSRLITIVLFVAISLQSGVRRQPFAGGHLGDRQEGGHGQPAATLHPKGGLHESTVSAWHCASVFCGQLAGIDVQNQGGVQLFIVQ